MLVVQDALNSTDLPRGGILTIGNYDGLHRGQQAIITLVVERARETNLPSMVVTFQPHPLAVLRPEAAPSLLTTPAQKERLLGDLGVEVVLVIHFTHEFSRMPARSFVREFIHGTLDAREIYVGSRFVFGSGRDGDLSLLRQLGESFGFSAFGVDEVLYLGEAISSTRIRAALADGAVVEVAEMLGRPYSIKGTVTRGDRMGKRLGWPTINLAPENLLLPLDGVYASQVFFPSFPASFDCVTNIGTRPTVYESYQTVVESHILDFQSDVYGEKAEIRFLKRLREERIFPTIMDLSAQIGRDVEAAREYFASRRHLEALPEVVDFEEQ